MLQPQTNSKVIFLVVGGIAFLALVCVSSLAFCLMTGKPVEQALLTSFVGLTTSLTGALCGLLINTRTTPAQASQTTEETTTTNTIAVNPPVPGLQPVLTPVVPQGPPVPVVVPPPAIAVVNPPVPVAANP